jgi:hypothetical protein
MTKFSYKIKTQLSILYSTSTDIHVSLSLEMKRNQINEYEGKDPVIEEVTTASSYNVQ